MSLTLPVDPKKNAKRAHNVEAKFSQDRKLTSVAKIIASIILNLTFPENYLVYTYTYTPPHLHTAFITALDMRFLYVSHKRSTPSCSTHRQLH